MPEATRPDGLMELVVDEPQGARGAELAALRARVEAATGGDHLIDVDIFWDLDPQYSQARKRVKRRIGAVPAYTASLDAALALVERVLPGWTWAGFSPRGGLPFEWVLYREAVTLAGYGATPALALLSALLAALSAEPPDAASKAGEGGSGDVLEGETT